MTTNTLAATPKQALAPWGGRSDVRELAERLKMMMVGAQKLGDAQALALAQSALAHGLDPFNGEIWMLPSGLQIGIKGLRKKARQQVQGNFWITFRQVTDPDERARRNFASGGIVYDACLYDSETIRAYVEAVSQFQKVNAPWEWIVQTLGEKPYTVGTGVWTPGEKTRMEPDLVARKRAEADALKRRFDVPFGLAVGDETDVPQGDEWTAIAAESDNGKEPPPDAPGAGPAEDPEQRASDRAALWGDEGAPDQTAPQREPKTAPPSPPAHAPTPAPALASLRGKVSAKFEKLAAQHASTFPAYQHKNGHPDLNHILAAAAREGFPTISLENVETVFDVLSSRAVEARRARETQEAD